MNVRDTKLTAGPFDVPTPISTIAHLYCSMMSPHMLGGMQMAAPQMMVMTQGPAAMQGKIVFLVGRDMLHHVMCREKSYSVHLLSPTFLLNPFFL